MISAKQMYPRGKQRRTWKNTLPVYSTYYSTFYCNAVKCNYQYISIDNKWPTLSVTVPSKCSGCLCWVLHSTESQEYATSRPILLSEIHDMRDLTIYCMNWSHAVVWWYGFTLLGYSLPYDLKHDMQMSNTNIWQQGALKNPWWGTSNTSTHCVGLHTIQSRSRGGGGWGGGGWNPAVSW